VQRSSYKILSYKLKHDYKVDDLLNGYKHILQKAIDIIWGNIKWVERRQRNYYVIKEEGRKVKKYYYVKRLIPIIPKTREFKRNMRNSLLKDWEYASHYVDSAIKTAYSILKSWRRNYLKGRRKKENLLSREGLSGLRKPYTFTETGKSELPLSRENNIWNSIFQKRGSRTEIKGGI